MINTHNLIIDFGKHKGIPYTRVPVSYLTWMVCSNHSHAEIAKSELERRGTTMPTLELSGHAIDRASLSCRHTWHETRGNEEGLHAWLLRISREALEAGYIDNKGRYVWQDSVRLAIDNDGVWPVVKTVFPQKTRKKINVNAQPPGWPIDND